NAAHAASHLHHPHIVPVYEVACAGGVHYYTMRLIAGTSLASVWHRQRQSARGASHATDSKELADTAAMAADNTHAGPLSLAELRWDTTAYVRAIAVLARQAAL